MKYDSDSGETNETYVFTSKGEFRRGFWRVTADMETGVRL